MDIEYNPEKALRFKEEGNVYFKQGNYSKALEFYEKAICKNILLLLFLLTLKLILLYIIL